MSEIVVSFSDITIRVPNEGLFPHVNFEVKKGEQWALVGENESLKTAVVEALAGNATIVNGQAAFPFFEKYKEANNHDPFFSPHRFIARIGDGHQFRNLANTHDFYYQQRFNAADAEDTITVLQYLEQTPLTRDAPALDIQELISKLHLTPLLDKKLIKLSHGETKRLLIASALLRNPEVLLFLHPFTGLDKATRNELRELINLVSASGITIIISTSEKEVPEAVTHVALFENDGSIKTGEKGKVHWKTTELPKERLLDKAVVHSLVCQGASPSFRNMVVMENVRIQYGEKVILDNINWTIEQGDRWALLGPNGAGKSTLLSLITADNPQAFANNIILFDRKKGSGESIWDIKRKIGFFSPELFNCFPLETSCIHAVESGFYDTIGLFRKSNPKLAATAMEWMIPLGVANIAHKPLRQVSPVSRRLCLLARALVKTPPLLVLDEPCHGFNNFQVARFKELINAICAVNNTTLIYVSHYKEDIPECVTKTFQLEKGKQVI